MHRGKNQTAAGVVTAQTFIVPTGSGTTIQTGGVQLCGAPQDVQECAGEGWRAFNHPRVFASRGDCLVYVITRQLESFGLPSH